MKLETYRATHSASRPMTHELTPRDKDFFTYGGLDAAVMAEIWPRQEALLAGTGNREHYESTRCVFPALTYMQMRGVRMDTEQMAIEAERCYERMLAARAAFAAETGTLLNLASTKELNEWFYKTRETKPIKNRTGGLTTDDKALKELLIRGLTEARHVQTFRKEAKLKSTYYEMRLSPVGRMHCQYKVAGTKTGRLASAESFFGYGTNMQNQPPALKNCVLADPGYLIFEADLSQAENRICAWAGPVPEMKECFRQGEDIHSKTASLVLTHATGTPRTVESISRDKGTAPFGPPHWSERDLGKRSNHALNWDMSWMEASRQWECAAADAKRVISAYHSAYPGVRRGYHAYIRGMIRDDNGYTTNPFGRRRKWYGPTWGAEGAKTFKNAYADYAQSTVARIINERGLAFAMESPDLAPLELLNQVHDSVWFQIPVSVGAVRMADMVRTLAASMSTPFEIRGDEIVIPTDVKAGTCLGTAVDLTLDSTLPKQLEALWNPTSTTTRS